MKFTEAVYKTEYKQRMGIRKETFEQMFDFLDSLDDFCGILETGCARQSENYNGDGMSTVLFDKYVNWKKKGKVVSVDLSPMTVDFCKTQVSNKTEVHQGDSVKFLNTLSKDELSKFSLVYLDSYDVDFRNPGPSAFHHMKELVSIYSSLSSGTLIVIDDNVPGSGKGIYARNFFENIGVKPYFDEYQVGWIKP